MLGNGVPTYAVLLPSATPPFINTLGTIGSGISNATSLQTNGNLILTNSGNNINYTSIGFTGFSSAVWTSISSNIEQPNSYAYNGNIWVCVGISNTSVPDIGIAFSTGGTGNWQYVNSLTTTNAMTGITITSSLLTPSSTTTTFNSVIWSGSKFIAMGTAGAYAYSYNGINWIGYHPTVSDLITINKIGYNNITTGYNNINNQIVISSSTNPNNSNKLNIKNALYSAGYETFSSLF